MSGTSRDHISLSSSARVAWLAFALAALAACVPIGWPPPLEARLERVAARLHLKKAEGGRYFRYAVTADDGPWVHEILLEPAAFATRRTRSKDGVAYTFGRDVRGAWLRVGDGETEAVDGSFWDAEARTQAAVYGLRFLEPTATDEADFMGRYGPSWEYAFRPEGGSTLTFEFARANDEPESFDRVDDFDRLVLCDRLAFSAGTGTSTLLTRSRCSASDRMGFGEPGRRVEMQASLEATEAVEPASEPAWALAAERRPALVGASEAELPIRDPRRLTVPVQIGEHAPRDIVLDSGAFHTILAADAARELGVVPTGEAPLFTRPPWLAATELWIGVVDKMVVGRTELHGERVLVASNPRMLGGDAGLLGQSFFRRFVVDVDSPAGVLRITPRERYRPPPGAKLLALEGGQSVGGEVVGVAKGQVLLDTGMPDDIVVHAVAMKLRHPRERSSDVFLGGGADTTHSPDYGSRIDGLRLGPFVLPAMDAIGRDRERERIGGGVAIVGMGVMRYFRLGFDVRDRRLYAEPGDAYVALLRAGLDVEDAAGPTLDRVIPGSPAENAKLRRGDVVLAIDGERVATARDVRRLLARHEEPIAHLRISRRGFVELVSLGLAPAD